MGIEIERKFLLADDTWRRGVSRRRSMEQGYLIDAAAYQMHLSRCSVRVRIGDDQAWLNIKAARQSITRREYEYPVPLDEAREMLEELCNETVRKVRHDVHVDGHLFEIDVFENANDGLVVAEIELPAEDAPFPHPSWLGAEVSHLPRYLNVNLATHPYSAWSNAEREERAC